MTAAEFIAGFEGFRSEAYPDPGTGGEPITIGYGTTVYPDGRKVRLGDTCTHEQAVAWKAHDLATVEAALDRLVTVPVNANQRIALASIAYNIGIGAFTNSTLLQKLNAGDYQGAAEEFPRWNRAGGRVMPGLVRRRAAEKSLFAYTSSQSAPQPVASPSPASHPISGSTSMDPISPFIIAAANQLIPFVPSLIRAFGGKGERTEQNAKTAEQVVEIAKQITGAQTAEGAVQAVAGDPAKQAELREAVHQNLGDVLDALVRAQDADSKAADDAVLRGASIAAQTGGKWWWLVGGVAAYMVLFASVVTGFVLYSEKFSEAVQMLLLGQVVLGGFTAVMAFMFGPMILQKLQAPATQ